VTDRTVEKSPLCIKATIECLPFNGKYKTAKTRTQNNQAVDWVTEERRVPPNEMEVSYAIYNSDFRSSGDSLYPDADGYISLRPNQEILVRWKTLAGTQSHLEVSKASESKNCRRLITAQYFDKELCSDAKCFVDEVCWHTSKMGASFVGAADNSKEYEAPIQYTTSIGDFQDSYPFAEESVVSWISKEF
jgi:hypothetical protein